MPTEKRTIRAVVFDMDDTLYPERDYVRSGYSAVGCYLRGLLGRDEKFETWLWSRFLAAQSQRAFDALNGHFQLGLTRDQIAQLVSVYREHVPDIRPYNGLVELVELLHRRYSLGILTDGFLPAQCLKLNALKIERFFDAVVFTEQLGRDAWKPSPAGFQAIRDRLDVPHEACAFVADNPAKDFQAANRFGWQTVQCLHAGQIHADNPACEDGTPQVVVRSLGQLQAVLM